MGNFVFVYVIFIVVMFECVFDVLINVELMKDYWVWYCNVLFDWWLGLCWEY